MHKVYLMIIAGLGIYIFLRSRTFQILREMWFEFRCRLRNDKLTMFDVRQLLIKGEKDLAIKVYCEIFKTDPEEACRAVEELERSIPRKDFEI